MIRLFTFLLYLIIFTVSVSSANDTSSSKLAVITNDAKKCLLVMSYHKGYEWNDGVEKGVIDKLDGVCQLKKIYLDTKRNPSVAFGEAAGLRAKSIIDDYNPDVLIASDDNVSRYVIEPYYKNKSLPVVFCGINWSASDYGYPYKNATGMVEVAPILPLLKNIQRSVNGVKKGVYLSNNVITEHKDFVRYQKEYGERGVGLTSEFVTSMEEWKSGYIDAQDADFIIISNKAGIKNWDETEIVRFINTNSQTLTVTHYQWMMPYAMLGMTKSAVEQGSWAGDVAIAILDGLSVQNIPITINKSWRIFVNQKLLKAGNVSLSNRILNHAYKSW